MKSPSTLKSQGDHLNLQSCWTHLGRGGKSVDYLISALVDTRLRGGIDRTGVTPWKSIWIGTVLMGTGLLYFPWRNEKLSDHQPIQLKVFESYQKERETQKVREYVGPTREVRGGDSRSLDREDRLTSAVECIVKVNRCMAKLMEWNRKEFGHDQSQIKWCIDELKLTHDIAKRNEFLDHINDLRYKEESSNSAAKGNLDLRTTRTGRGNALGTP
ncbi:hypothetical protein Cgig2_011505 [Carnegiea gigantea]|uniref:Uncharacterized protein n=1 Tax=Carnegiea gigantea TaxID=171969 RepID=A0A9Q1JH85_9CARY|nr:hypothetical protein Cgig2_011505 [Carnegiea gigantea]